MPSARDLLDRLLERRDLAQAEAEELLAVLADPATSAAFTGAVLAAMRSKGVVADEVRGFAQAMRRLARRPSIPAGLQAVDVVGTGGDCSGSLNISTGTALLTAACGLPVVKHGNRSISSRAGSADVLEALGLELPLDEELAGKYLAACNFTFLFAPYYHPATKAVAAVRAALGVRTVFNILGPLTNPAEPPFHVIGAFSLEVADLIARTLAGMPMQRAFVVHGAQGWDEPTPVGPFTLFDVRPGRVERYTRTPEDYGLRCCDPAGLAGGDAQHNARALRAVLEGEDRGPHRDCLLLGAALALEVSGRNARPREAIERAAAAIDSGAAARVLEVLAAPRREPAGPEGARLRTGRVTGAAQGGPGNQDFLQQMAAASRERVRAARAVRSRAELLAHALDTPPPPRLRLQPGGFDLIAELKLRSPAAGQLKGPGEDVAARVTTYARAGAAAVSVLTEPTRFDGSLDHLQAAARALLPLGVPAMRKDFLVDPYQVIEARVAGAGGVLAILRMLPDEELDALVEQARALELFVLLEAFDERDLERLDGALRRLGTEGLLAGVNSRDLTTLRVVPSRLLQLAGCLPVGIPRVAESGVGSAGDARRAAEAGYDLALVGSALMSGDDPAALASAMLSAARAARANAATR